MIHPSAVIDRGASIGKEVHIGPFSVIGPQVVLEEGVKVGSHVVLEGITHIGEGTRISHFTAIGQEPQDLHYDGEPTRVHVGKNCWIREYVTIHRGTEAGGGITLVGDHSMIMSYCHVAHDCRVGDHVVMANAATLAGHVEVQEYAIIGGLTAIHQHARVGRNAIVGGASAVSMDVLPFSSAAGNRCRISGVNVIGMRRHGFSEETIKVIRQAHRTIFRSNLRLEQAIEELESQFAGVTEVQYILEFLQSSQRGICR